MHFLAQGAAVGLAGAIVGALAAPGCPTPVPSGSASDPPTVLCHSPEAVVSLLSGDSHEQARHALIRVNQAFGRGTCEVHSAAFTSDEKVGRTITAWGVMSIMRVEIPDSGPSDDLFAAVLEPVTDL